MKNENKPMEKKKKWEFPLYDEDSVSNILSADLVASATDCTGLIPSAPVSEDEMDSYGSLYSFPKVKDEVDNHLQNP